jgi:hypothetical protein
MARHSRLRSVIIVTSAERRFEIALRRSRAGPGEPGPVQPSADSKAVQSTVSITALVPASLFAIGERVWWPSWRYHADATRQRQGDLEPL